ncbi:MAG: hypothetical protein HFE66_01800 [Clostridiales bacterium]|jgi:hypothetical protein|nr:hypothetical protein [Clostridiales bacterium]
MKKSIVSIAMLLVFSFALFPLQIHAAGKGKVTLSAAKQDAAVSVEISDAAQKDITSLQLSLGISIDSQDLEKAQIQFQFADSIKGTFRDFRLRKDTKTLTLYIAGTKNLFENDSLTLGTLSVTGIDGQAQVFFIENSLKTVNGAYSEETLSDITGNSVILGKSETNGSSSSNEGGTTPPSGNQAGGLDTSNPSDNTNTPSGNSSSSGSSHSSSKPSSKPIYGNGTNTNTAGDMGDTEDTGTSTIDKSGLEEAIKMAISLEENDYTAASYREMETALSAAQQILNDLHVSQEEVDEATLNLQNAIGALHHAGPDDVESEDDIENTKTSEEKDSDKAGQTVFYIVLIVGVIVVAGGITAAVILYRKKTRFVK